MDYNQLFGDALALYQENHPAVICPHEATEEELDDIVGSLSEAIRPFEESSGLIDSIQYHWLMIAKLIREIQPSYPSISSFCQIGVHTLKGLTGISAILRNTDAEASIRLTGDQV